MAAKFIEATAETAQTVYAVIRRETDGFLLNDADGTFSAAPADYFLTLTEHATVKGYYSASEARTVWTDGDYLILPYIQTGGAPATAADIPGEARQMVVRADDEVTDGSLYDTLAVINAAIAIIDGNVDTIISIIGGSTPQQAVDIDELLRRVKAIQDKLQLLVLSVEKQSNLKV